MDNDGTYTYTKRSYQSVLDQKSKVNQNKHKLPKTAPRVLLSINYEYLFISTMYDRQGTSIWWNTVNNGMDDMRSNLRGMGVWSQISELSTMWEFLMHSSSSPLAQQPCSSAAYTWSSECSSSTSWALSIVQISFKILIILLALLSMIIISTKKTLSGNLHHPLS